MFSYAAQSTENKNGGDRNVAIWKGAENIIDGVRKLRRQNQEQIIFLGHNKEVGLGEFDTHTAHIDLLLRQLVNEYS